MPVNSSLPPTVVLPNGRSRPYPQAPRRTAVDIYQGIEVRDPYRPLETMDSARTRSWVAQENRLTRNYLDEIPGREEIAKAVEAARHDDMRSLPVVAGNRFFYLKTSKELQNPVLCTSDIDGKNERTLVDPNGMKPLGLTGIADFSVSPDGEKIAVAVMRRGSDWCDWQASDVATGDPIEGHVRSSKYASRLQWSEDSTGFCYPRFHREPGHRALTAADQKEGTFFHRLGTAESHDVEASSEGVPALAPRHQERPLGSIGDSTYHQVKNARYPKGCLIVREGETGNGRLLVPEGVGTLQNSAMVGGQLIANYLVDGHSEIQRFDKDGKSLGPIALPTLGSVDELRVLPNGEMLFNFSGLAYPPTVYRYSPETGEAKVMWQAKCQYNPDDYETKLDFSTSPDGTRVPLYVTHRKDVPMDGQRPTYLYGYGGFEVNQPPENKANLNIVPWLDMGGVFVDTCLRGGMEYGENWHEDGMLQKKQHVFDDFEGAAQHMIDAGVTRAGSIAIGGRSNGGLLAAATELQRPELFGAVIPEVGVMDLMRFPRYTSGQSWVSEYGTTDKKSDVQNMLAYSPVHVVQAGRHYPSTLIITGDHDDRVVPAHSYKLAATLQQAQGADNPILLKVERDVGHGSSDHPWPKSKMITNDTDRWSFLSRALNIQAA